jgi:predicted enzyme related to lactoylglutathione lyase
MPSPIRNQIGAVFVPVSDMQRAIHWYSRLLGLPEKAVAHEGRIYDVAVSGETLLILDAHKPVQNSSQPLFFFWTDDLKATLAHLRAMQVEITTSVEDIGSVTTLVFKDPDDNLLMVCQRNSST